MVQEANRSTQTPEVPAIPDGPPPPIESRFLFVDVAALRAKQLRRGARRRFDSEPGLSVPIKPERAAMEEVRRGLVDYQMPEQNGWPNAGQG
jgi:DNA-directed RNA polymerase subunit K/omega